MNLARMSTDYNPYKTIVIRTTQKHHRGGTLGESPKMSLFNDNCYTVTKLCSSLSSG
jgi:hypothetical protein